MTKFRVTFRDVVTYDCVATIEAENEEEAIKKAKELGIENLDSLMVRTDRL